MEMLYRVARRELHQGSDRMANTNASSAFRVGFLLFPDVAQLDLTDPWEVFSSMPETECRLVWKRIGPVVAAKGLTITADTSFTDCPQLDLICVPGGPGRRDVGGTPRPGRQGRSRAEARRAEQMT